MPFGAVLVAQGELFVGLTLSGVKSSLDVLRFAAGGQPPYDWCDKYPAQPRYPIAEDGRRLADRKRDCAPEGARIVAKRSGGIAPRSSPGWANTNQETFASPPSKLHILSRL